MAKRRRLGHLHATAHRQAKRERGRGLVVDDRYAEALSQDPAAMEWLRRHDPNQARRIEQWLRERGVA